MKLGYLSRRKKRQIWETWEEIWDSFWEVPDLKLKDYFKQIYEKTDKYLYYPSRKNTGIFITKLFMAGGSNHFTLLYGKNKSENVETQRKIYNGSFEFRSEIDLPAGRHRRVDGILQKGGSGQQDQGADERLWRSGRYS